MFTTTLNKPERGVVWGMWLAVIGLMAFGTAFVFSATGKCELDHGLAWFSAERLETDFLL